MLSVLTQNRPFNLDFPDGSSQLDLRYWFGVRISHKWYVPFSISHQESPDPNPMVSGTYIWRGVNTGYRNARRQSERNVFLPTYKLSMISLSPLFKDPNSLARCWRLLDPTLQICSSCSSHEEWLAASPKHARLFCILCLLLPCPLLGWVPPSCSNKTSSRKFPWFHQTEMRNDLTNCLPFLDLQTGNIFFEYPLCARHYGGCLEYCDERKGMCDPWLKELAVEHSSN